ncbi:MAG: hypothetical protein QM528_00605 [Phycisphaerales bacterium]|nr:hypothetical protein [Phycisphaerales bacterium]
MKKKAVSLGKILERTELKNKELKQLRGGEKSCGSVADACPCYCYSQTYGRRYCSGCPTGTTPDYMAGCSGDGTGYKGTCVDY